jgi:hypothetical protein
MLNLNELCHNHRLCGVKMSAKFIRRGFPVLMMVFALSMGSLAACSPLIHPSGPSAVTPNAGCTPSQIQVTKNQLPEIQGTMKTGGELWALLFFKEAHAKEDLKIVWRMTGSNYLFTVKAKNQNGTIVSPTWGPDYHTGSDWKRPGEEWGTGFNFPEPGCWSLTASRGTITGEIRLDVLAP